MSKEVVAGASSQDPKEGFHWRYQPVVTISRIGSVEDISVSLIEAHFNKDGTLRAWTDCGIAPVGNDPNDLRGELAHMLVDAYCWAPVMEADLKPGMKFKGIPINVRKDLADMIDEIGERISNAVARSTEA